MCTYHGLLNFKNKRFLALWPLSLTPLLQLGRAKTAMLLLQYTLTCQ